MSDGQLRCPTNMPPPPTFVKRLTVANSLTGNIDQGIAVLVDSQVIWMQPNGAVRFGAEAQRPRYAQTLFRPPSSSSSPRILAVNCCYIWLTTHRRSVVRTVSIANYPTGRDTPFCGIDDTMFAPCATIEYAMNVIDSFGTWVTYSYQPGTYYLSAAISIEYTGTTIQSRDGTGTVTFVCSSCITIKASSTRIAGITFRDTVAAVTVSGFDVGFYQCLFVRNNAVTLKDSAVSILADAIVNMVDCNFTANTAGTHKLFISKSSTVLCLWVCHDSDR